MTLNEIAAGALEEAQTIDRFDRVNEALLLPLLLGGIIGGGVVWYVARRRRAAAILQTLAGGYSRFSCWLKDGGALYIDGAKGRYVSTNDCSSEPPSPAFDLPLTIKQAKKMLDRAGYKCLD